jgi:hypothetical protein
VHLRDGDARAADGREGLRSEGACAVDDDDIPMADEGFVAELCGARGDVAVTEGDDNDVGVDPSARKAASGGAERDVEAARLELTRERFADLACAEDEDARRCCRRARGGSRLYGG